MSVTVGSAEPGDAVAELLAAVYADPHDDRPRLVLADYLQEQGDSWGELIALQIAGRGSKRRVQKLAAANRERILGPFAGWARSKGVVIERGFPVEVHLTTLDARRGPHDRDHVAWGTVERLAFSTGSRRWISVLSPHMRALREVRNADDAFLAAAAGFAPGLLLEAVFHRNRVLRRAPHRDRLAGDGLQALLAGAFPRLHTLGLARPFVELGDLEAILASPGGQRLQTLVLDLAPGELVVPLLRYVDRVVVRALGDVVFDARGDTLAIELGEDVARSLGSAIDVVQAFDGGLRRLELCTSPDEPRAIAVLRWAERHGVDVAFLGARARLDLPWIAG